MAGNTKFGIDIVADDTTAKGFSSADKQAKAFASNQDKRNKTQAKFESAFEKSRAKAEKDRQDRLAPALRVGGFLPRKPLLVAGQFLARSAVSLARSRRRETVSRAPLRQPTMRGLA
jgi:hypothetical protein